MNPYKLRAVVCASMLFAAPASVLADEPWSTSSAILVAADDPRGENDGVTRTPTVMAKDAAITAKVKAKLLDDPEVVGTRIDVDTFNSVVMLSGTTATKIQMERALAIAMTVEGVKNVSNKLSVSAAGASIDAGVNVSTDSSRSLGTATKDAAITALVKTTLLADPDVAGMKIDVDTRNQVVMLSGNVDTKAQKDRAAKLAKQAEGVATVKNNLTVAGK